MSLVRARELLIDDDLEPARRAAQTAITAVETAAARDPHGDPTAGPAAALLCNARAILSEVDDLDGDHRTAAAGWLKAADAAVAAGRCGADHRSAAARSFAWDGQHDRARRVFERALHEAEQLEGAEPERARCLGTVLERRAIWHHEAGRTGQARDDAREAVGAYGRAGDATASAQAGLVLGRAHEAAGEPLAAEAAWRSALASASADTGPASRAVACALHAALAALLTEFGREADAAQHRRLSVAWADDEGGSRDAAADAAASAKLEAARAGARRAESAVHPDTDPELLAALAADPLPPVRAALASRADIPAPLARRLARDRDPSVAVAIAGNATAPRRAVRRAARPWALADARRAAAGNPRAGGGLCAWFALSGRWDVRRAVAANPACPKWLLAGWLALDRTWSVREAVAGSPRTPTFVLGLYGRSRLAPLRLALAGNPALAPRTAERLLHDRDVYVSGVAAGHPNLRARALSARFAEMESPAWMLRRVATNPRCPPDLAEQVLTWLALDGARGDPEFDPVTCEGRPGDTDQNPWQWYGAEATRTECPWRHPLWAVRVRSAIGRQTMPTKVLRQLARDPVAQVRRVVLGYTRLGQPLYHELAGDADRVIRDAAPRMYARDRTVVRLPGLLGDVQRHRTLRTVVPLAVWLLAVVLSPARVDPSDSDIDATIASFPEFTVDGDGRVRLAPDAVMPAAPRVELNGGGTVTVGRELASPRGLIVRIEADENPIVLQSVSWDSGVAGSPESSSRVLRTVVPPFESQDAPVPGRPSTVEVETMADGRRESHDFDVGSASPVTGVAP